jgi:AhpD family alkylhydroperoxidase
MDKTDLPCRQCYRAKGAIEQQGKPMPTVAMVEYDQASPAVRAVYDDIMATKGIDFVPNFWKTLASHPPLLEEVWRSLSRAMAPGHLSTLTKEMIALAVSATNGCTYCIRSHTAAARKLGMDDGMLGELMAVVGTFNQTSRLADGYQVEVDPQLIAATEDRGTQAGRLETRRIGERIRRSSRKPGRAFRSRSRASAE